jgi:2-haloacid dehalogenase
MSRHLFQKASKSPRLDKLFCPRNQFFRFKFFMKYSWILFDADDTIFDFSKSAKHSLFETLKYYGIEPKPEFYFQYKKINEAAWLAFERNEINADELRRIRFERFLHAIGEKHEPLEVNRHYLSILSETTFLIEGAQEMLTQLLTSDVKTGLITNGLKEVQRKRVERAALNSFFEVIVV